MDGALREMVDAAYKAVLAVDLPSQDDVEQVEIVLMAVGDYLRLHEELPPRHYSRWHAGVEVEMLDLIASRWVERLHQVQIPQGDEDTGALERAVVLRDQALSMIEGLMVAESAHPIAVAIRRLDTHLRRRVSSRAFMLGLGIRAGFPLSGMAVGGFGGISPWFSRRHAQA